jgi:hypothetical protein
MDHDRLACQNLFATRPQRSGRGGGDLARGPQRAQRARQGMAAGQVRDGVDRAAGQLDRSLPDVLAGVVDATGGAEREHLVMHRVAAHRDGLDSARGRQLQQEQSDTAAGGQDKQVTYKKSAIGLLAEGRLLYRSCGGGLSGHAEPIRAHTWGVGKRNSYPARGVSPYAPNFANTGGVCVITAKWRANLTILVGTTLMATGVTLAFVVPGAGAQPTPSAATVAQSLAGTAAAARNGDNGTVKIHRSTTPVADRRNQPHVCIFYLDAFGFDPGQSVTWQIKSWPPTGDRTVVASGVLTLDSNGGGRTGDMTLANGHYKLFWNFTGEHGSAKHKVFWVACAAPTPSPTPTPSPSSSVS